MENREKMLNSIKKYIVTWDILHIHVRNIASRLVSIKKWNGIIAVSRGGLVPGALLARELNIRYVDTICIASYNHNNRHDLNILKKVQGNGDGFIIIDDLVDTGNTAKIIRNMYPKSYFITIFSKSINKEFVDDYVIDVPKGTWIEQPWDMGLMFSPPLIEKSNQ